MADAPRRHEEGDVGGWAVVYEGFDPTGERLREALCTLGNGYFATRGAAAECPADRVHYPGTYVAGCYNRLPTTLAGLVVEDESLVNLPNWLPVTFRRAGGGWFRLDAVEVLAYRQTLDLRRGVLTRDIRLRDADGRTTRLEERRLVHMGRPHLAALETTVTPEDWSGTLEFRVGLDGRVVNGLVERYRLLANRHLEPIEARPLDPDAVFLKVQTSQSEIRIAQAARTRVRVGNQVTAPARRTTAEPGAVHQEFGVAATAGTPVVLEKVVTLHTSRDRAISEGGLAARTALARAGDFSELLASHEAAWRHLWEVFGIDIEVDAQPDPLPLATTTILRLYLFHLLQTVSPNSTDLDVGVPARGLHGEAYRGHVFWDELFVFPLLNLRMPDITRALLRYRYRRLGEARVAAALAGFRGAMFPWQSGSDGREETPAQFYNPRSGRWMRDHTYLERHVGSAIAHNVWQYYQVTGDVKFLEEYGAELICEIARFWASIATYNRAHDRYEIRGVMGPDEYHDRYPGADRPGLDNNAYTNLMAVWVLCRAAEVLDRLPRDARDRLCGRLALGEAELAHWDRVSRRMRLVFHADGILSQFEGYEALEEFDWARYRTRYGPFYRLDFILEAEGDTTNRYRLSKQADVLMLFYLFSSEELGALFERLGYPFPPETIPRNVDYYLHRSAHDSSLSRVVDSWVLARADRPRSWDVFREALKTDVADIQGGTTPEGIHLGAMAGTIDVLQRCYTGLELRGDVLWLNPRLPDPIRRLRLAVRYRGHSLGLDIGRDTLRVSAERCAAPSVQVGIRDRVYELAAGEVREFPVIRPEPAVPLAPKAVADRHLPEGTHDR
jgi:alpha,alpha-trehalase